MKRQLLVEGIDLELRTTGSEVEAECFLGLSTSTAARLEMPWVAEGFRDQSALS